MKDTLLRTAIRRALRGYGFVGASLAPYAATWLAQRHGIGAVGWYLASAGTLSLLALLGIGARAARHPVDSAKL